MHEVTASIELQMSLLLFIALGGYLLASRIGQPAVVGEILVLTIPELPRSIPSSFLCSP